MSEVEHTILVVDDNEAERYFVSRVLRMNGYVIREAASGSDALRLANDGPDLITLDVRLPDLSGFEVCRRLKADQATRDIPVLHISASFTTPEYRAEGLEGGADGYLTHPVDPAELVATVRSLLRAQRAEERVRAAAREWTTTFDVISDAVCLTGTGGEVLRCNRAFAALVNRPFGDIIGRLLVDLAPALAPVLSDEQPAATEIRFGDRYLRVSRSPGAAGSRAWVLGDVTDRKRAEEAAQTRLQEIEAVYNASPAGLCVLDRELRFVRVNERLAEINGLPMEAHIGRTVREVLPTMADAIEPKLRDVLETGRPVLGHELRGETAAAPGVERVWVGTWYPLRASDGGIVGINIAVEEITEQRLAQERLEQAQRLEAIGRLAGGVAHETNNQMTVVLGCANFVLRNPDLPDALREDLQQIRKAAERTAEVTAQLLAFGRRQVVRPEMVELNRIIGQVRPALERSLGESCTLTLDLAADLPTIHADVGQLEQVILNLALNARDAMPGGGTLTIRTRTAGPELEPAAASWSSGVVSGPQVVLELVDTGHGMNQETMRQAFEPFFTTKRVGQGTGLGLSMVYGVVRQSGGHIRVASTPGAGTSFRIYFPVTEDGEPTASGPLRTILLVEDDPSVRHVLARELTGNSYRVLEAADGVSALELVQKWEGRLDAVVSDLRMPKMDGLALTRALGELRPGLPVLLMSGHPDPETLARLAESGRPHIQKPFTAEELVRFIGTTLPHG